MIRAVTNMFLVVLVLVGAFFLLRNMGKQQPKKTKFSGARFSKIRREVNKGELVKDPVSGTYLSKQEAVKRRIDGKDYYFASEENAIQFIDEQNK